jgi:alpha-methylacyl-CoA racemase
MKAPLTGIKVLELAGLAPVPFCGRILHDFGAEVIRIDRDQAWVKDNLAAGKRSIQLDFNHKASLKVFEELIKQADVLLDPYRPEVLSRKGLSDDKLLTLNPRLVIAHLTGWGLTGPLAMSAGHDLNYLSLTGVLTSLGRSSESTPSFPQNLLADFAGGGLTCALGVVMALYSRTITGRGEVIDAAMLDGTIYLSSFIYQCFNTGLLTSQRGENLLDSGAFFYEVYACKDHKFLSVACIEAKFFHNFLTLLKANTDSPLKAFINEDTYLHKETWPVLKTVLRQIFLTKTREEWNPLFVDANDCVTPVLDFEEARKHPHNVARGNFLDTDQLTAAPAPKLRFSPARLTTSSPFIEPGQHSAEILKELNIDPRLAAEVLEHQQLREKL